MKCVHVSSHHPRKPTAISSASNVVAVPAPPMIGVGDVPGCMVGADPTPYLRAYGASILRVIVNPDDGANGSTLRCIQAAVSAGYRVHLVIQWWNTWTPQQVAAYFGQILPQYAPYLWAVSIGNEQELNQDSPRGLTGSEYAADWNAAEPVVAALAPQAIRVASEILPWAWQFLKDAVAAGLTGVQALAGHPYDTPGVFPVAGFVAWSRFLGLSAWMTEGLEGPGSWGKDITAAQMPGAAVADAWLG